MATTTPDLATIKTTTGLAVTCRHILGDDAEEIYRREQKRQNLDIATFLLDRCVVGVDDPGIYGEKFRQVRDFAKVLSGDRYHLLMYLRAHSIDDNYLFVVPCPVCKKPIKWEVSIKELPLLELPDGHLERLMAGEREFEDTVDSFGPVKIVYADGEIESKIRQDMEKQGHSPIMATILNRITAVGDVTGKGNIYELVKKARATLQDELFYLCGKYDCGLNIYIGVRCNRVGCGAVGDVTLPFDPRFLMPKSSRASF